MNLERERDYKLEMERDYLELMEISKKAEITEQDWEKLGECVHRHVTYVANSVRQFSIELEEGLKNIGKREIYFK